MKIGDKVIYTKDDMEYLGMIIAKKTDDSEYIISVVAFGYTVRTDGSDIRKLS